MCIYVNMGMPLVVVASHTVVYRLVLHGIMCRCPKQTIDNYECNRSKTRRSDVSNARKVLLLAPMERFYFVLSLGVDIYQIEQTLSECSKIHFSRTDTNDESRKKSVPETIRHSSCSSSSSSSSRSRRHTNKKLPWMCFKNRFQRSRK